ncbi:axin-1 isoform X2 [Aethina tumida]|uniref:axin-1 isoform X2 n=1 Tax=Aethina tumida TaxID=116153 RepID=UPI00096AF0EA|nr:axin-1 isoform X2 [Aethina tumida]
MSYTSSSNDKGQPQQQHQPVAQHAFDYTSPRPAVPGKERIHTVQEYPPQHPAEWRTRSPTLRKYPSDFSDAQGGAPCGYEPEGGSCRSSSSRHEVVDRSPPPPACLRWTRSLHALLQDQDGLALFRSYLRSEAPQHASLLDFLFACEGLRNQNAPETINQVVKVIYRNFFVKSSLPISEELRHEIGLSVKSNACLEPPVTLFDKAQAQVEHVINTTTYPNFLKSDLYLQHLDSVQHSTGSSSGSEMSSNEHVNYTSGTDVLPTLHEDMELVMNQPAHHISHNSGTGSVSTGYLTPNVAAGAVRLTKNLLLMSQKHRAVDVRPKSEAYASDGRSKGRSTRRQNVRDIQQVRELAALNKETDMHLTLIPRTQRLDGSGYKPRNREEFDAELMQKLVAVKREQDKNELLERKLSESLSFEDNDQDILDQHVSRVFSDQTPGVVSPRTSSPPRNRHVSCRSRRRDKDGFSTFSGDSGNVHDYSEQPVVSNTSSMVKSKSMPEYADDRFGRRTATSCRRSSTSKRALTDLTDSGVSVVSDTPPVVGVPPPVKDSRVLAWLMESDKSGRGVGRTFSEMSPKHKSHRTSSATSPSSGRYRKGYGSRSSSLERNSAVGGTLGPAQPFVADPNMPPLPLPNTAIQLEEARRRLEDDIRKPKQKSSGRYYPDMAPSGQSTLRKSTRSTARPQPQPGAPSLPPEDVTTVVFTFCDEQFPYRTKIPGTQVTLRQFKEYLPKKGNYRFFFKTVCGELDNQVIHEEVNSDADVLPLYEGKIMAQVKPFLD